MPNDTCASAIDLTGQTSYSVVVNTTAFAASGLSISCASDTAGHNAAFWSYTNTGSGFEWVTVDTGGSNYINVVSIWTGACGSLTLALCRNQQYASHSINVGFSVAPSQTIVIVVTDDGSATGGSLHLAMTAATGSNVLVVGNNFSATDLAPWTFYDGASGSLLGTASPPGSSGTDALTGAFAKRPSDSVWFSGRGTGAITLYNWGTQFVRGAGTTITAPTGVDYDFSVLLFGPDGNCYVIWSGISTHLHHCVLEQRNPTTFAVTQTWTDFSAGVVAATAGNDVTSAAFSPDGTILYYTTAGGTGADQNKIFQFTLGSSTDGTLATFGTYSGGVSATGDAFNGNFTLAVFPNGNVLGIANHLTSGSLDNASAAIYTPAGASVTSFTLTSWPGFTIASGVAIVDASHFWVAGIGTNLIDLYTTGGTRTVHSSPPTAPGGDDRNPFGLAYVANGGNTPVPPPTGTVRAQRRLRRFNLPFDGNVNVKIQRLEFLVQSGQGLVSGLGSQPILMCRFSKDGGQTWGPEMQLNTGAMGDYLKRAYITRGPFGRNLVCEVWDTDPVFSALLDCYVDVLKGSS